MFDQLRQLLCAATFTCVAAFPAFSQEPADAPAEQPAAGEQESGENEFTKFVNRKAGKTSSPNS